MASVSNVGALQLDISKTKRSLDSVASWGIASARHTSGVVSSRESRQYPGYFDAPRGTDLVRWDVILKEPVRSFQAHSDAIFCMRSSPNKKFIVTLSYGGEIKVWDTDYRLLHSDVTDFDSLHHLSWSKDSGTIAIVSNGFQSAVAVYSVRDDGKGLRLEWTDKAGQASGRYWKDAHASREEGDSNRPKDGHSVSRFDDTPLSAAFETCEVLPSGGVVVTENCPDARANLLHLYSLSGKHQKSVELMPVLAAKHLDVTLLMVAYDGSVVVGLQNGHFMVFSSHDMQTVSQFTTGYTARTCMWDNDLLLFPTDTGRLVWWNLDGQCVKEIKVLEQDYFVHIAWDELGKSLFVCGFSTLNHVTLTRSAPDGAVQDAKISVFHNNGVDIEGVCRGFQISCCGVEFSPSSQNVAVGDLAGNLWVCSIKDNIPVASVNVGMSVRCLVWLNDTTVIVGTLDGLVQSWNYTSNGKPVLLQHLEGSVIHMRWANHSKLLGVGTSHGVLVVCDCSSGVLEVLTKFTAHEPQKGKQDPLFGQLGKQAEIWSLCWSPDDHMLITCSEDQTCKVWKSNTWQLVTVLRGHKMAVTCVDWKMHDDRNTIATCSDDQTIRLISGRTFELLHVLSTKDVHGWHTLTYLAFHPAPDNWELSCATQNGHLLIWDTSTSKYEQVARGKMNCGSIEGLRWEPSNCWIALCGADCVVHVINIANQGKAIN